MIQDNKQILVEFDNNHMYEWETHMANTIYAISRTDKTLEGMRIENIFVIFQ